MGWYAVDLDGTLAHYDKWLGAEHIGDPIPMMLDRVLTWLNAGKDVRIFTARVHLDDIPDKAAEAAHVRRVIEAWCLKHLGRVIPITNKKDFQMLELWDDRCVQVVSNKGEVVGCTLCMPEGR